MSVLRDRIFGYYSQKNKMSNYSNEKSSDSNANSKPPVDGWDLDAFNEIDEEDNKNLHSDNDEDSGGLLESVNKKSYGQTEGLRRIREVEGLKTMRVISYVSCIGFFIIGYGESVFVPLSAETQDRAALISFFASAFLGSYVTAACNHHFGRRNCIRAACVIQIIGAMITAVSWNQFTFVAGRAFTGASIASLSLTIPLYIGELSFPSVRGLNLTKLTLFTILGALTADFMREYETKIKLSLGVIPSFILFFVFNFFPESPQWLVLHEKIDEAKQILAKFRDSDEAAFSEIKKISSSLDLPIHPSFSMRYIMIFRDKPTRRAVLTGFSLMIIQQLTSINILTNYPSIYYSLADFGESTSAQLSFLSFIPYVIGISISILLVDRVGRRKLTLISLLLVSLSLIALGASFYSVRIHSGSVNNFTPATDKYHPCLKQPAIFWDGITSNCYECLQIQNCGYCDNKCVRGDTSGPFFLDSRSKEACAVGADWIIGSCSPNKYSYITFGSLLFFFFAAGIGMAGMPWTINAEIFPLHHRSTAMGFTVAFHWSMKALVTGTFLELSSISMFTVHGVFWLYSFYTIFGLLWLYFALPETKGLPLEETTRLFLNSYCHRYSPVEQDEMMSSIEMN